MRLLLYKMMQAARAKMMQAVSAQVYNRLMLTVLHIQDSATNSLLAGAESQSTEPQADSAEHAG